MMPASVMAPVVTRSSLELMLDAIRRRDEQPRDALPALPARPTSRARLPSPRRSLPLNFKIPSSLADCTEESEVEKENKPPIDEKDAVVKKEIFGGKRYEKLEQVKEIKCDKVPELESYEDHQEEVGGPEFPIIAPTSYEPLELKTATPEDSSNPTLQGILSVQKHFRGLQARLYYQELKQGVIALQSFVRGEGLRYQYNLSIKRLRATVLIQKYARCWIARSAFHGHRKNVIYLQSVVRGWLARKHFLAMKNVKMAKCNQVKVNSVNSDYRKTKDSDLEHPQLHYSIMAELELRVLKAEAALREKEEENVILQKQLKQYEVRWSDYEGKMKSMEEMWQRQMASLQMSLATAKRSLAADVMSQPGKPDASPVAHYYDSEDFLSAETRTPEGTPSKQPHASSARTSDGTLTTVSFLVKEFEKQKEVFEDDAGFLIEVKSGQSDVCINPDAELQKLKSRFAAWKKDFKVRLQETKAALKKIGNPESKKTRRRWWGKKSTTKT